MNNDRDYRRALDFEVSVTHLQERSERRAWYVAASAVVVAILCAVALAVMVPFYRVVPLPIEVDRLTGEAQVIDVLDAKQVHMREVEDKHWVEVYVRSRERYDWGLLQMDYDRVLDMSDDRVARDYRTIYSGPDALDRKLGATTQRRIRILSTTLVPDEPGHAVVHIEQTTWKNGIDNAEPPQRFVITLAFTYRPAMFTRERTAIENPFGFRVTAYSRDPEYTPTAAPPAPQPVPGGAS
ncbi:virB8 family protein [Burkholderia multivorans]|uniref:virB8 family protein n=1 Tax=Burkholderia multivorans TaxID=87883 RepID=UPI001C268F98|nr:type IV secretion system protein [Burkholderia multivorans]MBU9597622.1 type IV secretion system protein [Burkholderia multivorans]MDN8000197.1 type IV secretion system protein [Burkholderia multivorans]